VIAPRGLDPDPELWHRLFEEDGVDGLAGFNYGGRACQLILEQQEKLKVWVGDTLPRTTREVGAWIEQAFGIVYESRSGLIALLHRLGLEHRKPPRGVAQARPGQTESLHRHLYCAVEDAARRGPVTT
jgi:transposase